MQFDWGRPEIAELLDRFKNCADRDTAEPIIETAADFLSAHCKKFDISPLPSSSERAVQRGGNQPSVYLEQILS